MRIRTITCHDVYNFGASLQAFALQTYLQSLGHDVAIIDYKPDYLSGHYKLWAYHKGVDYPIVKQLYLLAKLPGRLLSLRTKRKFDTFTKKHLRLTRRYNSYEELRDNPPEADCYIAGSDQIWNTLFKNGRDPAFYLDFGQGKVKRISYAASFATSCIDERYRVFVSRELKRFDKVSIRESVSLPLLESLGRSDGCAVCDPVFLLPRSLWENFLPVGRNNNHHYILVYYTENSDEMQEIAKMMSKKTGWKIYNIGLHKQRVINNSIVVDPFEFVDLIRDAEFVISNSFHATAFSVIFKKRFCVVKRSEDINERMVSFLEDCGVSQRMVNKYYDGILELPDYSQINIRLEKIVATSMEWLDNAINEN